MNEPGKDLSAQERELREMEERDREAERRGFELMGDPSIRADWWRSLQPDQQRPPGPRPDPPTSQHSGPASGAAEADETDSP